ncbi:MAG: B12-binding domain-containing radical SAM protein [Candidatus Helarchaeota archaeon]
MNFHNVDYDIQLINLPSFTSQTPSLALVSLATFLRNKEISTHVKDFSFEFFRNEFKNITITNKWKFNIPSYFLFGISNWLNLSEELFNTDVIPSNILKSLCPVSLDLYKSVFIELKKQKKVILNILNKYLKTISSISSKVIGFSTCIGNGAANLYLAKKIKEIDPNKLIIFGGPEVGHVYRSNFYLQFPFVDAIVYQTQGELPLYNIIKSEMNLKIARGIGFKKDGNHFFTEPESTIDLNKLPIPDYDLVETNKKFDVIDISFSRGCNSHCEFCNEGCFFKNYLIKSPSRVKEELEFYLNCGYNKFETIDTSFNNNLTLISKIPELIMMNNWKIEWGGNAELNKMSKNLLEKLVKSGLTHCYYGIESASKKILKLMKKPIDLIKAKEILINGHDLGLESYIYLIVGFPGELEEDYQKTKNFLLQFQKYINGSIISVYTLLNGSEMFNNPLVKPIQLPPSILNAFTYTTLDNITHDVRKKRFLELKNIKNNN